MDEKRTKINKNEKKCFLVFTKKCTFNEKRFSCDDCLGLLFSLTRPPTCGGCFTLQRTWQKARETAIRTVRLLHVCGKNIDFIDCCCVFCWRGRTSKKRRNRKMDFHRTRKTKKKQTKHTHRGKTSGRAIPWGATAARLLRRTS